MILNLQALPDTLHGPNDADYKGQVPTRARFLAPDAAGSLLKLEQDTGGLVYSDVWRSAESSLYARRIKRGVQPPGYSPHNYGIAVDLDLDAIIKQKKIMYQDILKLMSDHGWYCHRRDSQGPDQMEAWHFNYLGNEADNYLKYVDINDHVTWAKVAEARIYERYGDQFSLTPAQVQTLLKNMNFYQGEVDGQIGPQSREAIMAFQRAWDLDQDGTPGPRTQRTIAFVTAEKRIVTSPNIV